MYYKKVSQLQITGLSSNSSYQNKSYSEKAPSDTILFYIITAVYKEDHIKENLIAYRV